MAMAIFGTLSIQAQPINKDKVPAAVQSAFQAKFPNAREIKWEMEGASEYEANFRSAAGEQSAKFDKGAKWQETETEIAANDLPKEVTQTISTQYAGYKVKEYEKVETNDQGLIYELEMAKAADKIEVRFSPNGKMLKSEKMSKE